MKCTYSVKIIIGKINKGNTIKSRNRVVRFGKSNVYFIFRYRRFGLHQKEIFLKTVWCFSEQNGLSYRVTVLKMFNQTLQLKNRLEIRAQKVKKLAVSTRNTLIILGKIYQNFGTRLVRINIRRSKKKSIILPISSRLQ